MISNSGHDENGKLSGGKAGDQTGGEWTIQKWYNRPWTVVLRFTDPEIRKLIAELATEAAKNDLIGYDQGDRYTFWQQLKASGYHPKNIKEACEADCSAGVAAIVKSVGYLLGRKELQDVSIYAYTGNLKQILAAAGAKPLTDKKHLESDVYLQIGDILLNEGHHVAINLTDGQNSKAWYPSPVTMYDGLTVLEDLAIRTGPGTDYATTGKICKKGSKIFATEKAFNSTDYAWFRTEDGWISGRYLEGWIQEPNGLWWYVEKDYTFPAYCLKKIGGKDFIFDADGWSVSRDRIAPDNSIVTV